MRLAPPEINRSNLEVRLQCAEPPRAKADPCRPATAPTPTASRSLVIKGKAVPQEVSAASCSAVDVILQVYETECSYSSHTRVSALGATATVLTITSTSVRSLISVKQ